MLPIQIRQDLGNMRGDMYEIAVWEETIVRSSKDIMFATTSQEAIVIPETMDAIRAAMKMQTTKEEGTQNE